MAYHSRLQPIVAGTEAAGHIPVPVESREKWTHACSLPSSLSALLQSKPQTQRRVVPTAGWVFPRPQTQLKRNPSHTGQPELDNNGRLSLRLSSPLILDCGKLTIKATHHREPSFMSPEPWIMEEKCLLILDSG